ncbi:MAG TPA: sigma-70 family RNA polymerase sigma factor [Pyrinomonadaceae bacterium]|nr:sigma-70 family RNA polymerase sigma factor [Pyrinomonadaceae bacterium]
MPSVAANTARLRAVPETAGAGELERLFREHHEQVFRAAYRITGSATDAEDVLQTIFLRLASNAETPDLAPNPGGYLHRAAVNAALDIVRGRGRARMVSFDSVESAQELKSPSSGPEEEHDDRELRALLRHAVAKLGERAAAVFALRYFEGYDNNQIAELIGTSPTVVAVTLHRARTRLRREIGQFLEKQS